MKRFFAVCACLLVLPFSACAPKRADVAAGLDSYRIEATFDGTTVTGHLDYTVNNASDNTRSAQEFVLYGRAYREGACHAASTEIARYGDMSVSDVTVDGVPAETETAGEDGEILRVAFPAVYPDESAVIGMDFSLTLPVADHRLGITDRTVNLGNWYPTATPRDGDGFLSYPYAAFGDPFCHKTANYSVVLRIPDAYAAAASGRIERTRDGDTATLVCNETAMRDFAFVLSKEFSVQSTVVGDVQVIYCSVDDPDPAETLGTAAEALAFFGTYADYPYKTYTVCETPFEQGGMEYPALVYVSTDAEDPAEVIVHETAHQWWYALVGSDEVLHAWQDEGLAEFSTSLFYDAHPAYGQTRAERTMRALSAYLAYTDVYETLNGTADTSMDRALGDFSGEFEYVCMTYVKGELLFSELYDMLGDKTFTRALKTYCKQNAFGIASPDALVGAFEKAARRELSDFVAAWLEGRAILTGD